MSGPFKMKGNPMKRNFSVSPIKSEGKKKYTTKNDMIVLNDGTGRIGIHVDDQKSTKKKTNDPSNRPIGRKI